MTHKLSATNSGIKGGEGQLSSPAKAAWPLLAIVSHPVFLQSIPFLLNLSRISFCCSHLRILMDTDREAAPNFHILSSDTQKQLHILCIWQISSLRLSPRSRIARSKALPKTESLGSCCQTGWGSLALLKEGGVGPNGLGIRLGTVYTPALRAAAPLKLGGIITISQMRN